MLGARCNYLVHVYLRPTLVNPSYLKGASALKWVYMAGKERRGTNFVGNLVAFEKQS